MWWCCTECNNQWPHSELFGSDIKFFFEWQQLELVRRWGCSANVLMYLYLVSIEDSPDRWIAIMSVLTAQVPIHVSESLR